MAAIPTCRYLRTRVSMMSIPMILSTDGRVTFYHYHRMRQTPRRQRKRTALLLYRSHINEPWISTTWYGCPFFALYDRWVPSPQPLPSASALASASASSSAWHTARPHAPSVAAPLFIISSSSHIVKLERGNNWEWCHRWQYSASGGIVHRSNENAPLFSLFLLLSLTYSPRASALLLSPKNVPKATKRYAVPSSIRSAENCHHGLFNNQLHPSRVRIWKLKTYFDTLSIWRPVAWYKGLFWPFGWGIIRKQKNGTYGDKH